MIRLKRQNSLVRGRKQLMAESIDFRLFFPKALKND